MNVCINEQSIKDFVKLFKSQARLIDQKSIQNKEQLYKKMYNAALLKSGDPNNQTNIDVVVQHMLFLPIALNGNFPGIGIEQDLAKTMTAMNDTKAVSDLIKGYQKLIVDTIDVEEEEPIKVEDDFEIDFSLFNPIHVEVLTNQTPEYTGMDSSKINPAQVPAFQFIRDVLGDVLHHNEDYKILAIKLGEAERLVKKAGLAWDRNLVGSAVINPKALVFLITKPDGSLVARNNTAFAFSSYTNTPEKLFKNYNYKLPFNEQFGFIENDANARIIGVQKRLAEALLYNSQKDSPITEEQAMREAFKRLASELQVLNQINKLAESGKANGVLLDIDRSISSFGYIKQETQTQTKVSTVKDFNKFSLTTTEVTDTEGKVTNTFYALTGNTLYDTTVPIFPNHLDTDMETVNSLVELLTNPKLYSDGSLLIPAERLELFKKYVHVSTDTAIRFKNENTDSPKIVVANKRFDLYGEGLKEALMDHFTKFSVKGNPLKSAPAGRNIVTSLTDAKFNKDIYLTPNGEMYAVGKPNFSFTIKPENKFRVEGDNLILTPIDPTIHRLNNSYTVAEVNANNELRVYHPRIGFALSKASVTPVNVTETVEQTETPEETAEDTNFNLFTENEDFEDELLAANTIELETVNEKAEAAALKWFNEHNMSDELSLNFNDKKHPHALAQWFTSGITLYQGSNNTLIYHEAWHAFTQGILTKEQKNKLYFEVKQSYPNEKFKTDKDVEEFLAEKFRAYAMDKLSPKGNLLQKFFKNILDALKKMFGKRTLTDKYFQDLIDNKVDFSKYNPQENMYWGTMDASITPINNKDLKPLSADQSKLIVDTVNALVNEAFSTRLKNKYTKIKSVDDISDLYKYAKSKLIEIKEQQLEKQKEMQAIQKPTAADQMKISQIAKHVEALTFAISEFGDVNDIEKNISKTSANSGVIGAHLASGLFVTANELQAIAEEDGSKDENDPFRERNDISLEEYADKEILMLLGTIPDYNEKNEKITNGLGVQVLSNRIKILSKLGKTLMSLSNGEAMFKALSEAAKTDMLIREVLDRLPLTNNEPSLDISSQLLWSKFFQTFSKSNIPLKQLLFERVNNGTNVEINVKHGSVSSSTTQVRNDWNTAFENSPNVEIDIHGAYLNVEKALAWIDANPKATPAAKFNAIGINFTDNAAINNILFKGNDKEGVPAGLLSDFLNRLRIDDSIKTKDFDKRINGIKDLIKDFKKIEMDENNNPIEIASKGLGGFYNILQQVEFKYSNNYNSFMGTNAEGETASELVLNSSITHQINELNAATNLNTLIQDPAFEHLDGNLDPFKKANTWLNEMFDPTTGEKQKTKKGDVKVVYENFTGTKFFEKLASDTEFNNILERGLSNMSLDENSKFITDVYLSYMGKPEAPRMADKSSSFHYGLYKGDSNTPLFTVTNAKAIGSQQETNKVMYDHLKKYIAAELVRINTLKNSTGNIDKEYKKRGGTFFIFDGLLSNAQKDKLMNSITSTNFDEVLAQVEVNKKDLIKDINKYFAEKTSNTLANKKDSFYLPESVHKDLGSKSKDESKEILISMFERNQFLHYLNFTTLFLGDPALYNVGKEDFHKRIAGIISTGENFRHDKWMLQFFNSNSPFKSKDGSVANNKSRNYAASKVKSGDIKLKNDFKDYNGQITTAIINDHKIASEYLSELEKVIPGSTKPYEDMNEADGQGFISFDYYRMLSMSQGLWSTTKEAMYNNIVNGESFDQTKVDEFFESMKLQYYGPVKTDGLPGMAFHKFNLIPLIPNMIKGTKLENLHNKMMEQGIDYMTFASGSKLTSVSNSESESANDDLYDNKTRKINDIDFTPNVIHVKYLKNQIKIHSEFKGKITLPTQMRAILYAGLMESGVPKDVAAMFELKGFDKKDFQSKWEEFSEEEKLKSKDYNWILKYEKVIEDIYNFKKQELFNELGITEEADISKNSEKLANLIRSELTRSEIDDAQIDFLFNNNALKTDISLALTEAQVSKMLVSLIDKRLTKIKVNGEGLIQMASTMSESNDPNFVKPTDEQLKEYGSNGLRSYYTENGKVKGIQVKIALQGSFEKLLYINDKEGKPIAVYTDKVDRTGKTRRVLNYDASLANLNKLMQDKQWKEENKELFMMTTCRIPGQAMNSVEFMEVHSFLPKIAGNLIIVPSEMVAKSGSDFDVDKLFTMMPNLGIYNGKVKKIKALPKEDVSDLNSQISTVENQIAEARLALVDFLKTKEDSLANKVNLTDLKNRVKELRQKSESLVWDNLTSKEKKAKIELDAEIKQINQTITDTFNSLGEKNEKYNEIEALKNKLADLQFRKDGQTIKGLENNLIDVIIERLEREDNYADLVRPNDTNLVDGHAKRLESFVSPFDKYQSVHDKDVARTKISSSMIFDPTYNRNKQIENSVGKDTLGIGAVTNKYYSLFTRIGMYTNIDSNPLTLEDYINTKELIRTNPKDVPESMKKLVREYQNYNLHFPKFNSKKINNKDVIDLSSLYNSAGEYIPDILGQMINGWVDVAKGGWIFNIQGNKEATPTLLYLFMAGVPVEDAVNFVSVPAIRTYLEQKRQQQGALQVLNQPGTFNPAVTDPLQKLSDIDAYKAAVHSLNLPNNISKLYTSDAVSNLNVVTQMNLLNNQKTINTSLIADSFDKTKNVTLTPEYQLQLLNKFIGYEKIASQITSLTTATTFDTKASSKLNEVREKDLKLKRLTAENKALPYDILKRIDNSIVGKFESNKLILNLFSNFSALKNNKALVDVANGQSKIAKDSGYNAEDNVNMFQENFIWYLYQNENNRITDNEYKGVKLVEDASVEIYELKNDVLKYNPNVLESLVSTSNPAFTTIKHNFKSKNAALKFLTEYAMIEDVNLPKDSMHYILAKKALSDNGINESTIASFEMTNEDYEESILIAALESKALLASGNRETLMHGPYSYAKRLITLASEHGDLIGKFRFLQDIRHDYSKYSHNISLANSKETGFNKIYRQDLEILKAYGEIPEVQELFSHFDHFAVLQSGIKTSGKFNVTSIIDPAHISNVIGSQYENILTNLNKMSAGEAFNYSVLNLFTNMNYAGDFAKTQGIAKRGANFVNDAYFDVSIEVNDMLDLSYLEGSKKIEIEMSKNSNKVVIFPYAGLSETDSSKKQYDYFNEGAPNSVNAELETNDTIYLNSSDELTGEKEINELYKKYLNYLNKVDHSNNLTFNIDIKPGINEMVIAHLESLGYKKHPILSNKGVYYSLSKEQSLPVDGLYNTKVSFEIKDDNILAANKVNDVIKAPISQLVSKQLANKFSQNENYEAEKNKKNPNWDDFIKSNFSDNVSIELAYKYVVSQIIKKDAKFKAALINTSDAVLLSENITDKLNNMYSRALMDARKNYINISAVTTASTVEKRALLTTSSGFLSAGALKGFNKINKITGAEIYDGQVFNRVEADAIFNKLNTEFPKVLADPKQGLANFPGQKSVKSIYYGPIPYKFNGIATPKPPGEFPSWLNKTVRELENRMGVVPGYFDTALINRYEGVEQGLGMHTDAEPNLVGTDKINPTVLTLSLGAERIFKFEGMKNTPYENEKAGIPTKHGHVLVMGKDSQFNYKHGIEANSGQSGVRYSITLRHTPDANTVGRTVDKSTSSNVSQQTANPSDYTNHSGGAYGGDTFWDMIGREFGVSKHMHYKDAGNANLSQKLKNAGVKATVLTKEQMDKARTEVEKLLGKKYPDNLEGNLQVRNYYQVANADAVFAIAEIIQVIDQDTSKNNTDITKSVNSYKHIVKGGTNTAVQIGIKLGKPVYVWDLATQSWYKWDNNRWFEKTETPMLTPNFAGIGSRDIENYNVQKEGKWVPREQYKGKEVEEAAKQAIRDVYANTFKAAVSTGRKTYSGNVTSLKPNQIFVFGSNPEGKHGKGAAKAAVDNFGAVYGQGEGIQGQSYALPTKDLRVKENNSLKSISPETITSSIKKLYEFAKQNPTKEFLVSDYSGTNLNGYTGQEMADMFNAAGPIPSNIVFNENFDKLISEKPIISTTARTEDSYKYYGKPYAIIVENGVGIDVVGYKGKPADKNKLLANYNANPDVDPQNGKPFRFDPTKQQPEQPTKQTSQESNKYELFPGVFANEGQVQAIDKMIEFINSDKQEFLLKGRGGTGKTTIVKKILKDSGISEAKIVGATVADEARGILQENLPKDIKTYTTASLLGLVPDYSKETGETFFRERNEDEQIAFEISGKFDPIEGKKLILIDEASMISKELYDIIMKKKSPNAKVIFMGDNAQIPPINDDGTSTDSPVFELEKSDDQNAILSERMRQGEESPILPMTDLFANNIENIQNNKPSVENPLEGNAVNSYNPTTNEGVLFTDKVDDFVDMYVSDYNNSNSAKHVVLVGARVATVTAFNERIRRKLFDTTEPFVVGDMIRVNTPHMEGRQVVYANGFKGRVIGVTELGPHPDLKVSTYEITIEHETFNKAGDPVLERKTMTTINPMDRVAYKSAVNALAVRAKAKQIPWTLFYKLKESVVDINYNYAITSHKVQGSTYTNVYVLENDIMNFPGGKLQTNRMMYTALSRPTTKLVVLSTIKPAKGNLENSRFNNGKLGC